MMISKQTAMDIALAYREVETSEKLLAEIDEAIERRTVPDMRDAFGRRYGGLQVGVPSSSNADSQQLFNLPCNLARPIIRAHIAEQKALIEALCEQARAELGAAE